MSDSATLAGGFEYDPVIDSVTPSVGPTTGGTSIVIRGDFSGALAQGATVIIGGNVATTYTLVDDTEIIATTPLHAAGAVVDVTVSVGGLSGTLVGGFTYEAPGAAVSSVVIEHIVMPSAGDVSLGTVILYAGEIGEVTGDATKSVFEVRSMLFALKRQFPTRVYDRRCGWRFGDSSCTKDLASLPAGAICNKSIEACRGFANVAHFGGQPNVPGALVTAQ